MADFCSIVRVVIDCAETWESRKAKMNINGYFYEEFNERNFPISIREGQETFEMRLVNSLQEEGEAVKNGWDRAKVEHLMAYAAQGWDWKTWVVARGSSWRSHLGNLVVPVLRGIDRKRYLYLSHADGYWNVYYRFLMARKCA